MIRINKGEAPKKLIEKEKKLITELKKLYDEHQEDYDSGCKKFTFKDHYKIKVVKEALKECQNNKCCFSEATFNGDHPHVEHFRPKGGIAPHPKGKLQYPGYYWLAYNWDNLFLCKSMINGKKGNYFPLEDGSPRNRNHNDNNIERPLLINVHKEDPRKYIRFHNDEPYGINEKGKFNVCFLNLRYSSLREARIKKLQDLKVIRDAVDLVIANNSPSKSPIKGLTCILKRSMKPEEEFSSMAIDFLQDWPHLQ